jgi:microcystin-dependent protein
MPSTVRPEDFCDTKPQASSDPCVALKTIFFTYPDLLCQLTSYLLDSTGMPSEQFRNDLNIIPVGLISPYAGLTPPWGWALCDGGEVNRITEARLFSVIGTMYGAGDGVNTFNKPDLRQRVAVGSSPSVLPVAQMGGSTEVEIQKANLPDERVEIGVSSTGLIPEGGGTVFGVFLTSEHGLRYYEQDTTRVGLTQPLGQGAPLTVQPPYTALNYIIKL